MSKKIQTEGGFFMKLNMKKILCLGLVLLLAAVAALPVCAAEAVDFNRKGSISLTLKAGDKVVPNAPFSLFCLGLAGSEGGMLSFSYLPEYEGYGKPIGELKHEVDSNLLADYIVENDLYGDPVAKEVTDENGELTFSDLPLGVYLAVQTAGAEDYSLTVPVLCATPDYVDGKWVYDVNANPKPQVERMVSFVMKKVWNDDEKNRPDSVEVALKDGDKFLGTVVLSAENDWQITMDPVADSDVMTAEELNVAKGYYPTCRRVGDTFIITNTDSLIYTGQLKWPIPALAVLGVLLVAGGVLILSKEKKKDHA